MRVLGISDHITAGAAVIEDGRVVAAVNEERLRAQDAAGLPARRSAPSCSDRARARAVDAIAVGSKTGEFLDEYVDVDGGVLALDEGVIKKLLFSVGARTGFPQPAPVPRENLLRPEAAAVRAAPAPGAAGDGARSSDSTARSSSSPTTTRTRHPRTTPAATGTRCW